MSENRYSDADLSAAVLRVLGKDAISLVWLPETVRKLGAAILDGEHHQRVVTCVWCGYEFAMGTPTSQARVLKEHALICALHPLRASEERVRLLSEILIAGLQFKGGWREAIVELEDFCGEEVRIRNMVAAADQLDEWAARARAACTSEDLQRAGLKARAE